MKKAIYLDDRERELARCICDWNIYKCNKAITLVHDAEIKMPALRWFKSEIYALRAKFEEPES